MSCVMMILRVICIFLLILSGCVQFAFAEDRVLVMGYRTNSKEPLIAKSPDNSGLYRDLYEEAARRIGFELKIIRLPKVRVLLSMQSGEIDFYPVFIFSQERAKYTFFIDSGLRDQNVAITLKDHPDIMSFEDMEGLTFLQPLGNANYLEGVDTTDIDVMHVAETGVERMLRLIKAKRADVTIYQLSTILYNTSSEVLAQFKIHYKLLPDKINLPLGFSLKSKYIKYTKNAAYDPHKELTIDNYPYVLDPSCVTYRFQKALESMQTDGFTEKLYDKYYRNGNSNNAP